METALAGDAYDGAIVIAETIRWHWDLSTSGGDAFLYRERLLALMKRYGFDEYVTDEADVRSDPANALVARIGGAATPEHVQHFHALRLVSRRLPHPVADAAEPPSVVHTAASGASIARVLVGDYMTADPLTVAPEDTLHAAWRIMLDRKVRHLPVLLDGKLVGVLTDRDIKEAMPSSDVVADPAEALSFLAMVRVQERMQHQVLAAAPTTAIAVAAGLLLQHRIGCLPVVDDGHVVGILTQTDLLRA
ncbi:MAG: CBS domain-containing protein, partial [Chloroflexi bacterium]|nr:CBS domain-containing protein [Chloroflexota bacterium]